MPTLCRSQQSRLCHSGDYLNCSCRSPIYLDRRCNCAPGCFCVTFDANYSERSCRSNIDIGYSRTIWFHSLRHAATRAAGRTLSTWTGRYMLDRCRCLDLFEWEGKWIWISIDNKGQNFDSKSKHITKCTFVSTRFTRRIWSHRFHVSPFSIVRFRAQSIGAVVLEAGSRATTAKCKIFWWPIGGFSVWI